MLVVILLVHRSYHLLQVRLVAGALAVSVKRKKNDDIYVKISYWLLSEGEQ